MIVPRYMNYCDIGDRAYEFLRTYHPSFELPIPIEEIVELQLGLDIVPMPNLLDIYRIDGFLTSDRTAIYVDEGQYREQYGRYRFTLAHEVGHFYMHKEYFESYSFTSVNEYVEFVQSVDRKLIGRYEVQGMLFAEQVLVPEDQLLSVIGEVITSNIDVISIVSKFDGVIVPYIAKGISKPFQVSSDVIECRISHLEKENRLSIKDIIEKAMN
jgi:Zn-dependent peptidase ImmA (M78 family)